MEREKLKCLKCGNSDGLIFSDVSGGKRSFCPLCGMGSFFCVWVYNKNGGARTTCGPDINPTIVEALNLFDYCPNCGRKVMKRGINL